MGQKRRRRACLRVCLSGSCAEPGPSSTPLRQTHRRAALLAGTALATTLLLGSLVAPTPASAVVHDCADPGPDAVEITAAAPVICINTEVRNEAGVDYAISIETTGVGSTIFINNSGMLTAVNPAGDAYGIRTETAEADSTITIWNSGDIAVQTAGDAFTVGIYALTSESGSHIAIENTAKIDVFSSGDDSDAFGVFTRVFTFVDGASTRIVNSDAFIVTTEGEDSDAYGISAAAIIGSNSSITVVNKGA